MNKEVLFSRVTESAENINNLLDEIEAVLKNTCFENDSVIRSSLCGARERVREKRFRLAFVGDWNSGKSSLINRLLFGAQIPDDSSILPVKDEPTTSRVTIIQYGPLEQLRKCPDKARSEADTTVIAVGQDDVRAALRRHGSSKGTLGNAQAEHYNLVLEWPSRILQSGLQIVDTPGLCDPQNRGTQDTEQYVTHTDGVVVVTNGEVPFSEHLWEFLENRVFQNHMRKVFFIMNKIDLIDASEGTVEERLQDLGESVEQNVSELMARFKKTFAQNAPSTYDHLPTDRCFAVSAQSGVGLERFILALNAFVKSEKPGQLIDEILYKITTLCGRLTTSVAQEKDAMGMDIEKLNARAHEYAKQRDLIKFQKQHALEVLYQDILDTIKEGKSKIPEVFESARGRAQDFLDEHKYACIISPKKLSKLFSDFDKDEQRKINHGVEDVCGDLRRKAKMAFIRAEHNFIRCVKSLEDFIPPASSPIANSDPDSETPFRSANQIKAFALSGGLAVLTGAATVVTGTTTVITSTLPSWLPGAAWAATHGWFTASTTVPIMGTSWAIAMSWAVWPAGLVMLSANTYFQYKTRKKILSAFEENMKRLSETGTEKANEIGEQVWNIYLATQTVTSDAFESQLAGKGQEIEKCQNAARTKQLSPDALHVQEHLPTWRKALEQLRAV